LARRFAGNGCDGRSAGGPLAAYLVCGLTSGVIIFILSCAGFAQQRWDSQRFVSDLHITAVLEEGQPYGTSRPAG
jgi:hypothetical protein